MKYSTGFDRDFIFYLRMRKKFNFSGDHLRDKNGEILIVPFLKNGADGKHAFFVYESIGKVLPTKHPLLFFSLLKTKASANFHVKELYSSDRAKGFLCRVELEEIYDEINPPQWFIDSVEKWTIKHLESC